MELGEGDDTDVPSADAGEIETKPGEGGAAVTTDPAGDEDICNGSEAVYVGERVAVVMGDVVVGSEDAACVVAGRTAIGRMMCASVAMPVPFRAGGGAITVVAIGGGEGAEATGAGGVTGERSRRRGAVLSEDGVQRPGMAGGACGTETCMVVSVKD